MPDIPTHLNIAGTEFARIDSPDSIACWTATLDSAGGDDDRSVSIVIEPAASPEQGVLQLAAVVVARFDEFTDLAAEYLQQRLGEPEYRLSDVELLALQGAEPPFGEPEAVIWADGSWMLRFAESRLEIADPYGIGVLFDGTSPCAIEDLSDADSA